MAAPHRVRPAFQIIGQLDLRSIDSQIGSPMSRKITAMAAVRSVAAHGQSVLERHARKRGNSPSSLNCDSVRAAPAKDCIVP